MSAILEALRGFNASLVVVLGQFKICLRIMLPPKEEKAGNEPYVAELAC
jgi:hypothetical protein